MSTTVLVVEDRPDVRGLLRAYLALNFRPQLLIAGEATDGDEAVCMSEALQPDIVVLGDAPGGETAIASIRRAAPRAFVILRCGASAARGARLHPPDREVARDGGLGPLGDALAEAERAVGLRRETTTARRVVGG